VLDVIKEYLVSLGFQVDNKSVDEAKRIIEKTEKIIGKFATNTVTQVAAVSTGFLAFIAIVDAGIVKFVKGLAMADLETEKFARRMWTSKENARDFKNSLDSMGASLEDLYLSPELMNNFMKLREQSAKMSPGQDYFQEMKGIRSIIFEFQRLKLEVSIAFQWIGYYISKYLAVPLAEFKKNFQAFNDKFSANIAKWTKPIAQVISWFGRLGIAAVKAGAAILHIFNEIPKSLIAASSAFLGLFTLLKMGPIGWIIAGLTTILLLLDDFYTYQSGGESALGDLWGWLDKIKKDLTDSGVLQKFQEDLSAFGTKLWEAVKTLGEDVGILIGKLTDLFNTLARIAGFKDFGDLLEKTIIVAFQALDIVVKAVTGSVQFLIDLLKGDLVKAFKDSPLGKISDTVGSITGGIGDAFSGMGENFNRTMRQIQQGLGIYPQTPATPGLDYDYKPQSYIKSYIIPQSNKTNSSPVVNNDNHPTYNIFGTDPSATAQQISNRNDGINTRNFQGVLL
jgi:hypothetical protein